MGVIDWLRGDTPSDRALDASLLGGGGTVVSVDTTMHRGLLSLAGYTSAQISTTVSRYDAMKVPALAAGVSILTGIAAQLPLVADPSDEPKSLLEELDPTMPRGWTIAKTVDDLIFYGVAWWYVTARTARDFPRSIQRVDPARVQVDYQLQEVRIDGLLVRGQDVIRFDGLTEGLLSYGGEAIATALANVRQTRTYAENPRGQMVLTDADGAEPLEPDQARDYIVTYSETMRDRGIGYLAGFKVTELGYNATDIQLIPARQQDAVEMSRLLAIPTRYVSAPEQGSSLTYANLAEVRRDLIEVGGLAQYMVPIEQRLSMPDVTPRGTVVKFDAESYFLRITPDAPAPETPPTPTPEATV